MYSIFSFPWSYWAQKIYSRTLFCSSAYHWERLRSVSLSNRRCKSSRLQWHPLYKDTYPGFEQTPKCVIKADRNAVQCLWQKTPIVHWLSMYILRFVNFVHCSALFGIWCLRSDQITGCIRNSPKWLPCQTRTNNWRSHGFRSPPERPNWSGNA